MFRTILNIINENRYFFAVNRALRQLGLDDRSIAKGVRAEIHRFGRGNYSPEEAAFAALAMLSDGLGQSQRSIVDKWQTEGRVRVSVLSAIAHIGAEMTPEERENIQRTRNL